MTSVEEEKETQCSGRSEGKESRVRVYQQQQLNLLRHVHESGDSGYGWGELGITPEATLIAPAPRAQHQQQQSTSSGRNQQRNKSSSLVRDAYAANASAVPHSRSRCRHTMASSRVILSNYYLACSTASQPASQPAGKPTCLPSLEWALFRPSTFLVCRSPDARPLQQHRNYLSHSDNCWI